jgi:hypothetical protein
MWIQIRENPARRRASAALISRSFIVVLLTDAFDQPVGLSRNMLAAISR